MAEIQSFSALGFEQADEKTATFKMVKLDFPSHGVGAWVVHPVSGNRSTEAWTSFDRTVWTPHPWGRLPSGWWLKITFGNGLEGTMLDGQAQIPGYPATVTILAHFAKYSGIPKAFLALQPSVNRDVVELLHKMGKKAAAVGANTSATLAAAPPAPAAPAHTARAAVAPPPQSAVATEHLRFTSATRLVVQDGNQSTAEDIAKLFSAPHLYGFKELDLSQLKDGCPIAAEVVLLKPPFLRSVIVAGPPSADSLGPLCLALTESPYVEVLHINASRSNELLEALFQFGHRFNDVNTPTRVMWLDGLAKISLLRAVPLQSVAACVAGAKQLSDKPDDTLVIELLGTRSPPLLRSSLRFSAFLTELMGPDRRAEALELPSHWRNEAGEEELENRFTDVDVKLAVLWLNEYASDAVHEMVKEDPTAYFVSLQGQTFFEQHIHKADQPRATLRRCLSLLALAHYLRIDTLESLMLSLLSSRQCQLHFDALAK